LLKTGRVSTSQPLARSPSGVSARDAAAPVREAVKEGLSGQVRPVTELVRLNIDDPGWHAFVERCQGASAFHHPAWAGLLADSYGFRAFILALRQASGIVAGLPVIEVRTALGRRRWISLPFTDHCPPLAADADTVSRLAGELDIARRSANVSSFEIRATLPSRAAQAEAVAVSHALTLRSDSEAVLQTFNRSQVRRSILKAASGPVEVRSAESRTDLTKIFYELHLATRRRLGVPVQPRRFFELLWDRMIEPRRGRLLLAHVHGAPVAGGVFLEFGATVTYKFGASDPASWKYRPNHALFWTAIRDACVEGRATFDFGRTDFSNEGLRAFKNGWGTTEAPLVYSGFADHRIKFTAGTAARALSPVIRRSPVVVCRAVGELLYKYAA
jgi:CelD/BcsL family acetyltransferase involved in cellulose biosynthesis